MTEFSEQDDEPVWRFDDGGLMVGPYSMEELREYAVRDYITPATEVMHEDGRRSSAGRLGLFGQEEQTSCETALTLWHYEHNGRLIGPFAEDDLRAVAAAGLITAATPLIAGDGTRAAAADSPIFRHDGTSASLSGWRPPAAVMQSITWLAILPMTIDLLMVGLRPILEATVPGQQWIHAVFRIFYLVSIPVAVLAWAATALYAAVTGICYDFSGRPYHRRVHRVAGIFLLCLFAVGLAGALVSLAEFVLSAFRSG